MEKLTTIRWKNIALITPLLGMAYLLGGCASSEGLSTQGRISTPTTVSAGKSLANAGGKYAST